MSTVKRIIYRRLDDFRMALRNPEAFSDSLFTFLNMILAVIAGLMSIVNIITGKHLLLLSTAIFTALCLINSILFHHCNESVKKVVRTAFFIEVILLCSFFCISGTPEGFSALWTCFIPTFSLTILGIRRGTFYSALGWLMIVAVFWTSFGRSMLMYDYTSSFMLRFPMIYIAFYLVAFLVELSRQTIYRQMVESRDDYQFLYKHDALTKLYNRHGFNEMFDAIVDSGDAATLTLMIIDLDHFKEINDTYGHQKGDEVLKEFTERLVSIVGEDAIACRWGGDEFAVLLKNCEAPDTIAKLICQKIDLQEMCANDSKIHTSVSIGVCTVTTPTRRDIPWIVYYADQCMYNAKGNGRNQMESMFVDSPIEESMVPDRDAKKD